MGEGDNIWKKGYFFIGRGVEKEKEGKEGFFCRKGLNGYLIKQEVRLCLGRRGVESGFGGNKEVRYLDQLFQGFEKE